MQKLRAQINSLTADEDVRQELWVYILSKQQHTLQDCLQLIIITEELQNNHQLVFSELLNMTPDFEQKLKNFNALEREIILYIILGFSPDKISRYKGISMVRLEQIIESIRFDSVWVEHKKVQ